MYKNMNYRLMSSILNRFNTLYFLGFRIIMQMSEHSILLSQANIKN